MAGICNWSPTDFGRFYQSPTWLIAHTMMSIQQSLFRSLFTLAGLSTLHLLSAPPVQAQYKLSESIDGLIARENLQSSVRSYYLRPLLEIQQGSTQVQGDGRFSEPKGSLMRQFTVGVRLGYRSGPLEIETGLSSVRVGAGYQFRPEYNGGLNSRIRSNSYTQIPLNARYRFWQPTQRLSFRVGAGVGYNVDLNQVSLAPSSIQQEYVYGANGGSTIVAQVSSTFSRSSSFLSGEINLSAYYQLSKRFSVIVEGKRLFSSGSIVRLESTREVYNPAEMQRFNAIGGANGFNLNFGMSYQFGFRNHYQLSDK